MDKLSRAVRGKSVGKLLEVLRHRLRGIQGDEDNIAASYRERGLPPPEHIETPPAVEPENLLYWQAYADLQHERPPTFSGNARRIGWSSIAQYAKHHGLNVDELKRFIWALDSEFLQEPKALPAPDQAQAEDQANG